MSDAMTTVLEPTKDERSALDQATSIVRWMSTSRPRSGARPLSFYDGAEPLMYDYLMARGVDGNSTQALVHLKGQLTPDDVERRYNVSWVSDVGEYKDFVKARSPDATLDDMESTRHEKYRAAFVRVRTVSPKACRGLVRAVWPLTVEVSTAMCGVDGTHIGCSTYAGWTGSAWKPCGVGNNLWNDSDAVQRATVATALQYGQRYDWRVHLGLNDGPAIAFITDPIGVCEAFRLRDIPDGAARRAALLHWVSEHWRKKRSGSENDLVKVKQHLRGKRDFSWNGLVCRIRPSAFDEQRLITC